MIYLVLFESGKPYNKLLHTENYSLRSQISAEHGVKHYMTTIEELELRAAFQVALLGMISPDIRSISFDFISSEGLMRFRTNFASLPHDMALENMSCVLTEVEAGLSFRLNKIDE